VKLQVGSLSLPNLIIFNYFYVKLKQSLKGQIINVKNKAAMIDNCY